MDSDQTFLTILMTAILTTVGTIVVTFYGHRLTASKDISLQNAERERHARYAAIRLVCVLDAFVIASAEVATDTGEPDMDGRLCPTADDPVLTYPDDIDWKTLKSDFMYRALALPNEVDGAKKAISNSVEFSGPPDYDEVFEERWRQFGQLGLEALQLTDDLRREYEIPVPAHKSWDPKDVLTRALEKVAAIEKRRAKFNEEMFARMEGQVPAGDEV